MSGTQAGKRIRVHFEPDNITAVAEPNVSLLETAIAAGVHINAACGGTGVCGTCKVLIEEGKVASHRTAKVSRQEYARGVRQACQSRPLSDLKVQIPPESRLEKAVLEREMAATHSPEVLVANWEFKPPVGKLLLELKAPTLKDNTSDLTRLLKGLARQHGLANIPVDFGVVKKLSAVLRKGGWRVTVTVLKGSNGRAKVINVEPGDTRARLYGLVFDIGTTGVRGQLLDLNRGQVLAQGLDYNGQLHYGADVISRIAYSSKRGGLKKLQQAAVATVNGINKRLLKQAKVKAVEISHMVVAANTTMVQLLLGLDPKYLRLAPYVPTAGAPPLVSARSLGIRVAEHVYVYTIPSVASYVGGDIVAGILGTGVYQRQKLTLYIDIGTNGEIAIGNSDWMVTASCSAGPAFEGGGIKHGMIATPGAIEDFAINHKTIEPEISTIGNGKAKGICGTGLINIVAGLLEADVISQKGKFHHHLPGKRIRHGHDGYEYALSFAAENAIGKDIVLTEVDIDNLVRAKAAIYAGCQTLIKSAGSSCSDIDQAIIAGTFGSNINIDKAITIGLLPDLKRDKFIFIGNGSLLGARLTAFSSDLLEQGKRVARMMTNLELSENSDFMHNYVAALFLPHTHADDFPSVKSKLAAARQRIVA